MATDFSVAIETQQLLMCLVFGVWNEQVSGLSHPDQKFSGLPGFGFDIAVSQEVPLEMNFL